MINFWKKNKLLVIILLVCIFLLPSSLSQSSNNDTHLICVGLGIDLNTNGEFELSTQVIIPEETSSFKQKLQVYSATGESLHKCVQNLNMHVGKEPGLAHCTYVVVNENVLNGELLSCIDYLIRAYAINFNCAIIATDKTAKDILILSSSLNNSQGLEVPGLLDYNNDNIFSKRPNIETLYNSVLGGSPNYVLSIFSSSKKDNEGVKGQGEVPMGETNESQGGEESKNKDDVLINTGKVALMNKSQLINKIDISKSYGVRYINPKNKEFNLTLENFSDELYENATIEFHSNKKQQINKYYFENGTPTVELNLIQFITITGVNQKNYIKDYYSVDNKKFSQKLIDCITEKIKQEIFNGIDVLKQNNCDAVNIFNAFEKYQYNKFYQFLNSLEKKENYFQYVNFKINVKIEHYKE
jgi:hypothetical protein